MDPRKNAYEISLGQVQTEWTDRKGKWRISGLIRTLAHGDEFRYETTLKFISNPEAGLKSKGWGYAFLGFNKKICIESFRRQVKRAVGYTPSLKIQESVIAQLEILQQAHLEEDRFYAPKDKAPAYEHVEACFQLAMNRYYQRESLPEQYTGSHRSNFDRFVSKEEQQSLTEAFKVINGHACVMPENGIHGGHMHLFRTRLRDAIDEADRTAAAQKSRERLQRLEGLLETDPGFRRLVAHALAAAKTSRYRQLAYEYELSYRLYGYAKNIDEMRKSIGELREALAPYQLETYDVTLLMKLGRAYLNAGGILPPVSAPFERDNRRYYFGDKYDVGGRWVEVRAMKRLYLYLGNGSRVRISEEKADIVSK
ncbi:hypothetical protein ACFSR7_06065 [Cohnella sp. GCM10020058]|uniref:hypothetical protein n=1 Tax=Cohnella sp. GCM10020058 TaxID=3317330 RepID=UPI003628D751